MEELKKARTAAARRVTVRRNKIVNLTLDRKNVDAVREELALYREDFDRYRLAHEALLEAVETDDVMQHEENLYEAHEKKTLDFMRSMDTWLAETEERKTPIALPPSDSPTTATAHVDSKPPTIPQPSPVTTAELPTSTASTLADELTFADVAHLMHTTSSLGTQPSVPAVSSTPHSSTTSTTPSSTAPIWFHPTSLPTSADGPAPASYATWSGTAATTWPVDSLPWTHSTGYPGPQAADNRFQSELGNRVSALSLHDNPLMLDPILTALTIPSPDIEPFKGDIENYRMFCCGF